MFEPRKNFPRRRDIIKSRQALLCSIGQAVKTHPDFRFVFERLQENHKQHYVGWSLDNPLQVSYSDKCHRHDYKRRLRTTLGRYITRQLGCMGQGDYLEDFINTVLATRPVDNRFTILKGEKIRTAYEISLGGHSCMTGQYADRRLDIYVENDNISLLVYKDEKITARALIWHCIDNVCIDRVYPNDGYHISLFQTYAKKQGWLCRDHNSLPSDDVFFDGTTEEITIQRPSSGLWPYLDSFRYTDNDPSSNYIELSSCSGKTITFNDTDGGWEGNICDECGELIFGDVHSTEHGILCDDCYHNLYTGCDSCGDMCLMEDVYNVEGNVLCDACYRDQVSMCHSCNDDFYDENLFCIDGYYYCSDCAEGSTKCNRCGEYTFEPVNVDDEQWCLGCAHNYSTYCALCDRNHTTNCPELANV